MNESQATHDNSLIVVGKSKNNKGKCTINFCGNKLMTIFQLFGRERYQQTRVKKYPQCYNIDSNITCIKRTKAKYIYFFSAILAWYWLHSISNNWLVYQTRGSKCPSKNQFSPSFPLHDQSIQLKEKKTWLPSHASMPLYNPTS